jgi:hypothetical protein
MPDLQTPKLLGTGLRRNAYGQAARRIFPQRAGVRRSPVRHHEVCDFTLAPMVADEIASVDFVITNPPFRLAFEFIKAATAASRCGFAMLVRSAFLEGADRHQQLFSVFPPTYVLQFAERVAMLEGRLVRVGAVDPFAEKPGTKVSTATAYCWLIWLAGQSDSRTRWVAPSRVQLERPGDYPDYVTEVLPPPADGLFAVPDGAPIPANRDAQ